MSTHRPARLILASDPAFSREITANWPQDPAPRSDGPEFIILDEGFSRGLEGSHYDLAIADASSDEKLRDEKLKDEKLTKDKRKPLNKRLNKDLKQSLAAAGKPAILIHSDPSRDFYNIHGAVLELRREAGVGRARAGRPGRETLRRCQAEPRAREAEKICAPAQAEATL